MKRIIKQILRGCGYLPHVGEHPGWISMLVCVVVGAIVGGLIGAVVLLAIFLPIHFYGAYERAEMSDKIERMIRDLKGTSK